MIKRFFFGGDGAATQLGDVGLLLLRLFTGLFIAFGHGRFKLPPPERFISGVEKLGFPAPGLFAWMAAISEFGGGILLALGLLTRVGALMVISTMAVAVFLQHRSDPLFAQAAMGGPSKEMALLYLVPAMFFLFTGSGRYGVDAVIRPK